MTISLYTRRLQECLKKNGADLERLTEDFKMAVSLLRDLADLQNGAPLPKDETEFQMTMDNIYAFLNKHESKLSN